MEEKIILAIAIGSCTGFIIMAIIVLACFCNCVGDNHLEKNEHSTSQETSSTGTEGDFVVVVREGDSISTLTRTLPLGSPSGMDITVETFAQEWRNTDKVNEVRNTHAISQSPTKSSKKGFGRGDHGSVSTKKINNCTSNRRVAKDELSLGTEKVNNCTAMKMKTTADDGGKAYLSGESLNLHNEKLRSV